MGAGDPSMRIGRSMGATIPPRIEIMTGAPFPHSGPGEEDLDACVKVEDIRQVIHGDSRYIEVSHPVASRAHRRPAGSDIPRGACLVSKGQVIHSSHIMLLASAGEPYVYVYRRFRVGIWSTGKEIRQRTAISSYTNDANGPYLTAALGELGADVRFMGAVGESGIGIDSFKGQVKESVDRDRLDLLISTGGVSMGRFDFVRAAISQIGAHVHFHGLPIRPGHPVLFASFTASAGHKVAFFGLPGNPGATAATFKFLVSPFVADIAGNSGEEPTWASMDVDLSHDAKSNGNCPRSQPQKRLDYFRHGIISNRDGKRTVKLSPEQSSSKVLPFAQANCWVHIPAEPPASQDARVACYELFPGSIPKLS